uniref:Uncharacterized protein n=1 Tax=Mycena chlorophos TaxID=658473 RepID=A0ABQ0M2F0_MYCCL|nr:predicted protein [Mycena chlorophos]
MPLPPVVRTLDRCWCDVWTGGFFEPFNVSQWEEASILRLATELTTAHHPEVNETETKMVLTNTTMVDVLAAPTPNPSGPQPKTSMLGRARSAVKAVREQLRWPRRRREPAVPAPSPPAGALPALRWEYDLRSYGVGLVVDFAW